VGFAAFCKTRGGAEASIAQLEWLGFTAVESAKAAGGAGPGALSTAGTSKGTTLRKEQDAHLVP